MQKEVPWHLSHFQREKIHTIWPIWCAYEKVKQTICLVGFYELQSHSIHDGLVFGLTDQGNQSPCNHSFVVMVMERISCVVMEAYFPDIAYGIIGQDTEIPSRFSDKKPQHRSH